MATADFVSEVSPTQQQLPILDYFHFFISSFILSILAMLLPVFQKKKRHQKYFEKASPKCLQKALFTV
jgi:hypothetical protein